MWVSLRLITYVVVSFLLCHLSRLLYLVLYSALVVDLSVVRKRRHSIVRLGRVRIHFRSHFFDGRHYAPMPTPNLPTVKMLICNDWEPGLPDVSWSKHTKLGIIYQMTTNYTKRTWVIPNGHNIYHHLSFKGPPKFTQIGIFWFENRPSGNPAENDYFIWPLRTVPHWG
jgi:hypothetical protein